MHKPLIARSLLMLCLGVILWAGMYVAGGGFVVRGPVVTTDNEAAKFRFGPSRFGVGISACPSREDAGEKVSSEWATLQPNLSSDALSKLQSDVEIIGGFRVYVLPRSKLFCVYKQGGQRKQFALIALTKHSNFSWLDGGSGGGLIGVFVTSSDIEVIQLIDEAVTSFHLQGDFRAVAATELNRGLVDTKGSLKLPIFSPDAGLFSVVSFPTKSLAEATVLQYEARASTADILLLFANLVAFRDECPDKFAPPWKPFLRYTCEYNSDTAGVSGYLIRKVSVAPLKSGATPKRAMFVHGGPRGAMLGLTLMSSSYLQGFDEVFVLQQVLSQRSAVYEDINTAYKTTISQVRDLFDSLSDKSSTPTIIAESFGARLLSELKNTERPLEIVLLSGALDGASKVDSIGTALLRGTVFISPTLDIEREDGRDPTAVELSAAREIMFLNSTNFNGESYDRYRAILALHRLDPLNQICNRSNETKISIIHGVDDVVAPFRSDKLNLEVQYCRRRGAKVKVALLNSARHGGPALLDLGMKEISR